MGPWSVLLVPGVLLGLVVFVAVLAAAERWVSPEPTGARPAEPPLPVAPPPRPLSRSELPARR